MLSARDIGRTARERHGGAMGFAEALLLAYNRKSKYGLHQSKLYGNRYSADKLEDENNQ
jgi:hypothetical protein